MYSAHAMKEKKTYTPRPINSTTRLIPSIHIRPATTSANIRLHVTGRIMDSHILIKEELYQKVPISTEAEAGERRQILRACLLDMCYGLAVSFYPK